VQDRLTALARSAGSLRPEDLERFHDAYYRANGATLILVGQFDPEGMMKQVTELFGAWPSEPSPALAPVPTLRPVAGPTWIADIDPEAVQVGVSLGFAATSPRTARGARLVVAEMVRDRVEQVRFRLGASYGIEAEYGIGAEGDLLKIDGKVDAARAGEAVRQIEDDLDGLRTGDAGPRWSGRSAIRCGPAPRPTGWKRSSPTISRSTRSRRCRPRSQPPPSTPRER
jgi:hypothetical protein